MIAQYIGLLRGFLPRTSQAAKLTKSVPDRFVTRDFLKAPRIHDYGQLKKIPCGTKRPARARVIHEIFG